MDASRNQRNSRKSGEQLKPVFQVFILEKPLQYSDPRVQTVQKAVQAVSPGRTIAHVSQRHSVETWTHAKGQEEEGVGDVVFAVNWTRKLCLSDLSIVPASPIESLPRGEG